MADRVMLLIDADNLSVDVMEQALRLLLNQHGAVHVRRAYCTAESAVANQAAFKRLGIKPMVNLAAGKNSTDIAMAVDAVDLVLAERPDVVVIASSDSDFAPLVQRLREKGCVVRGIGQQGKTGDETQAVYDDFTVLEHRKSAAGADADAKPARKTARAPARKAAAKAPTARKAAAAKKTVAKSAAAKAPRKAAAARGSRSGVSAEEPGRVLAEPLRATPTPPATPPVSSPASPPGRAGASAQAVLDCLPEVAAGQSLALNVAVQRLREAQLLGRNSSSLKLFAQLGDAFELSPADKPTQVRLRR
jgi:uncharacterized protein (TIGR00288 family)